ncbi:MAG: hypothetical protein AMS21_01045 [Gemmatimonas sp. SG8_38_2]|nr:MAG: hypothetical protein AMS21_01045 [Gemmatimonas sp. SG8_38_2]
MNGKERETEKATEEREPSSLEAALEWACNTGMLSSYTGVSGGELVYAVRIVGRFGEFWIGRSKKGYADALLEAHGKFLSKAGAG